MLKQLPALFLLLFLIIVFQLFSQFSFADGSKDLFPSSGTGSRSSLMSASTGFYPAAYAFINNGVQKVFVNAGETIYMGSSAQGKGSGTILVFKPSTTGRTLADAVGNSGTGTNTANTPGVIYNRTQELLGPISSGTATTSTGYQPFKVIATETGVYEVDFIAPTGAAYNSASAPTGVFDNLVSNGWTSSDQSSSSPSIIAWDVAVANSGGTVIPGRVYMNVFNTYCSLSNISTAADGFFGKFYILTKDGFPYLVNNNGMNGIAFSFFVNNRGFTTGANGTGTRTYKSLNYSTNPPIKNPNNADDADSDPQQNITHKIFYAAPAADLPASATYMGTTTWLKVTTPAIPAAVNISFTGIEGSSGQTSSKGGNITFISNIGGSYRITIPGGTTNGTTFYPRVLAGPSVSGSNTVFWDEKSGTQADPLIAAAPLPPGSSVSSIKVQVFGAEIHFPFLDVEQNPNGIIIEQVDGNSSYAPSTNPDGSFKDVVYWDDSDITLTGNSNPSSGSNSGSGTLPSARRVGLGTVGIASNRPGTITPGYGHQWNEAGGTAGYGNERALDTYSFVSGAEQTTAVAIIIKQADLEVTSISSSTSSTLHVGDSWSYTAVIKNNGPDAVVTNTNSANGPLTTGAKFQLYVPGGVTIDPTQVTMTSACATIQGTPTFSAGVFSAIVDMPVGCTASFVIPVTAASTVLTENTNVNTYATILRPADYTDPDATNTTSTAPTDPFLEATGVAVSNTIFTNSASVNTASTNNIKRNSNVKISVVSTQTITFAALPAKAYGDADFNAGATASSGLAITYASSNPAVATVDANGLIHILTTGTTDITASQTGNSNYSAATPVTQTLTVNKAPLTITADNQNKLYGAAIPTLTASFTGFVNGDTNTSLTTPPVISTTATATSPAGSYPITASGATSNNYTIGYAAGTLTIGQASQSITFTSLPAKVYGDADFSLAATASSGLAVSYTSSNPLVATVDASGNVHIISAGTTNITASQAGNSNYLAATAATQNITVNKAPLTITADSQNKPYGAANPVLTASYTGFVNGDTNTSLTAQPAISTTATPASAVGNYPITASGATSNNYTISYTTGNLTVGQSSQTITFNSPVSNKNYGDADFSLAATASSGLPITYISSNPSVATVDASGNVHILSAGTAVITASQAGDSNYSAATLVTQNITVNKALLTITADNQNKAYGAANPTLTASYNGFVNGETYTSLTAQPAISTTATAASTAGTYPISISGATSNNYTITSTAGTLTVVQSAQSINFNTLAAKTYGDADFTLSGTSSSGLPVVYTSSDASIATITGNTVHILKAGTVTITASQAGNSNYNAAASIQQTLSINPAALTITADNQSKAYNTANPVLTVSYSGFVNGDTQASLTAQPTLSTTATTASSVGTYPVTVSGAANNNYTITYVNGVFTIGQSTPTVTFNALSAKTYGDADFTLAASSSNGLPITYTSSNPAVAMVDASGNVHILSAGTAVVTALQAGNGNYSPSTSVQQILTVNKALLTITANSQSKTYGSANPAFIASYSGFVNGDTNISLTTQPTIGTTATAASATGTYPITVSGAASNNYNIAYVNGTLSVYPGAQIITFTVQPRTYGDADFPLNATASSGLPVSYSSSNPAVATVDASGTVHIVSAGNVTISALQPGNGNYIATTTINQQLTINKAFLTITADTLRKVYGAANPALTVTYNGFVNGDTNASLTTQPTVGTTANVASAVGVYPITVAGAASANYLITYRPGTLTVGQNSQILAYASPASVKTYGDADFSLPATSSSGLLVSYTSSNPEVATVDASGTVHVISTGSTTFTASQPGNANYLAAAPVTHILTVNKASLAVTSANQSKTYGAVNPPFTATYTGFVNGDTNASLTTPPTFSTTAATASAVGTYSIIATNAAAANYSITYTDGTLTVVKAALTISADNQTRVTGLANPTLTVSYTGFTNGDTPANLTAQPLVATTATASSAPGTYPITVSGAASDNYTISYTSGTLTVTNATVSSVSLAQVTLFENQPAGTLAGTLAATPLDPNATYTYTLIAGTGSTDNALFSIQGNKLVTAQSLDYEQKASYSILVRATNQYGLYLDQTFTINLSDVNEAPTLAAIGNQSVCNIPSNQNITLTGITSGPETAQTTTVNVSSSNPGLFNVLNVSNVTNGAATLTYQLATTGTAVVTVTVKDNGGTANGGADSFSQTFTLTSNSLPVAVISSDKGTQISKGETITLTATGGSVYSWDSTPNVSGMQSSATIKVRPGQTTTYQVKVSNASGCSSTSSITIQVNDDYLEIHPGNIVTPNGDGKNDTWVVKNLDLYPDNTVSIFDRGGRKLLEVKHYNNDWNGTMNGSPLAEGTYYYVIDFGPGKGPMKGFITILRNR